MTPGPDDVTLRRAVAEDVPAIQRLLQEAHLPDRFVEEYIDSFLVGEAGRDVVACGGIEVYDDTGVVRSVVVDQRYQGRRVGHALYEALLDDARRAGVSDLYLFTMEAAQFWQRFGFVEVPLADWRPPARECWQYRYVSSREETFRQMGLCSMWRRVEDDA